MSNPRPSVTIEQYNTSLVQALTAYMEGDDRPLLSHKLKFGIAVNPNPVIERISTLKAVTARADVPMRLRSIAKTELVRGGYQSKDDGNVPILKGNK